jgi:hypothetical protein
MTDKESTGVHEERPVLSLTGMFALMKEVWIECEHTVGPELYILMLAEP